MQGTNCIIGKNARRESILRVGVGEAAVRRPLPGQTAVFEKKSRESQLSCR
jgi:hypothetical protein